MSSIAASFWQGGTDTTAGPRGTRISVKGTGFGGIGAGTGAIGTLAFGAIAGGAGSALGGGNFWQGAVTGLIVAGFNHLMHDGDPPKGKKAPSLKEANEFYTKNKNSNAIFDVDASSVDLNFLDVSDWVPGKIYTGIQTLIGSKQGKVFGRLNLKYIGNNQVEIQNDIYDFNIEPLTYNPLVDAKLFFRNIATAYGQYNAGSGTKFTFKFNGVNTKNKGTPSNNTWSQTSHGLRF